MDVTTVVVLNPAALHRIVSQSTQPPTAVVHLDMQDSTLVLFRLHPSWGLSHDRHLSVSNHLTQGGADLGPGGYGPAMSVDRQAQQASAPRAAVASFDSADYELRWPPTLVARELAALRVRAKVRDRREQIAFLLDEVFLGETPGLDFAGTTTRAQAVDDPWSDVPRQSMVRTPTATWIGC